MMKKKFFCTWQKNPFLLLTIFAIAFSSCKKPTDVTTTPVSGLMAFNLIPGSSSPVLFTLSNSSLTNIPLSYTSYTGSYISVYSGNRELEVLNANSNSILTTSNFLFEPKKYYSAFAIGANGKYLNVITDDKLDSLPTNTGNAFVRYINSIPDSSKPIVTIASNGNNLLNEPASFGSISAFTEITPGDISINIDNDSTIKANRTISVEKDKVYTLLLLGIPKATDTTNAVQIKYIQNGTITP
jgi:hypothetical protein